MSIVLICAYPNNITLKNNKLKMRKKSRLGITTDNTQGGLEATDRGDWGGWGQRATIW